jgi:multidrug efflux pump subunit AcrB
MNPAAFCLKNRVVTIVFTFALLGAGILAYESMGRLEDPEFTIKDALVITPYPGASALEVEQEVTDEIEIAVQKLGQLKEIQSRSERGLSTVTVTIQDKYDKATLPQVWDELRRKVGDAQRHLPPGAGTSMVVDDYGDVYGVLFVIHGSEYTYAELKKVSDLIRRELLLVDDVAKVEPFGERQECIDIELNRDRMAELGIPELTIAAALRQKNLVTDTGRVKVGPENITISPTGTLESVAAFETLLIRGGAGEQIFLRDIATVRRGYIDPMTAQVRYDGNPGIALGISTQSGGNVVTMGEALYERMRELQSEIPLGIEFGVVSLQSEAVTQAISGFVISLIEAVAIVIVVLLFFMGARSGFLIGFVLVVTILGSFVFLKQMGVALERISLGALIIALGMLVDNAIVVVDGMLVGLQRGKDARDCAIGVVKQSAIPLLGATVIAVLAFAAIGTSQDSTGEFCRSLFQVVLVSLLLSWVTAVTVTPLLGVMFLKAPKSAGEGKDAYDSAFYRLYRGVLRKCIRLRWASLLVIIVVFLASVVGFGKVRQSFFPPSTRAQFMVDFWLPQGTHIDTTIAQVAEVEGYLEGLEGVTHVTSTVAKGSLRFLLTYASERTNPAYAQFLVDVEDPTRINGLIATIEADLLREYPDAQAYGSLFQLGPGSTGKVQARFIGDDPEDLRRMAESTLAIMNAHPNSKAVRTDWRQRVKTMEPQILDVQANLSGIRRSAISDAIQRGFEGSTIGVYREDDLLLPIRLRSPAPERMDVSSIRNLQVWSGVARDHIPLRQVVSGFRTTYEDEIIIRKDRKRTLTVFCDPREGDASVLFGELRPQIEALELPAGVTLEWGGEYEDSGNAKAALAASIPTFIAMMVLVTILLFNSLRQPLVIWLCVPLALVGVTGGLLLTSQPFGFMALLGGLSLIGMLIKNAIVLIDQINLEVGSGKPLIDAIVDSGVSRLRPVGMAASTTVLGMLPLLFDAFFVSMAVTVIFGLMVASVLTMVVLPVIYSIIFRARPGDAT